MDRSNLGAAAFLATNGIGTFTLLEGARERKVSRFLHISTDEVYGSIARGASLQRDPLNPSDPYSAAKAAADLLARAYWLTHRLPVVITRSSNNFGPYQYPEKVIPLFITNALEDRPVPLYGDGRNIRDWFYVLDNCAAIDLVFREGKEGGDLQCRRRQRDWDRGADASNPRPPAKPEVLNHLMKGRPGHDRRYALDSGKIHALGWNQPIYPPLRSPRPSSGTRATRRGGAR